MRSTYPLALVLDGMWASCVSRVTALRPGLWSAQPLPDSHHVGCRRQCTFGLRGGGRQHGCAWCSPRAAAAGCGSTWAVGIEAGGACCQPAVLRQWTIPRLSPAVCVKCCWVRLSLPGHLLPRSRVGPPGLRCLDSFLRLEHLRHSDHCSWLTASQIGNSAWTLAGSGTMHKRVCRNSEHQVHSTVCNSPFLPSSDALRSTLSSSEQ